MQNFYTVRLGDTLFGVSRRFGIPLDSLAAANNIPAPFAIYIGQQLSIPPGTSNSGLVPYYIVQPRDTLFNLAVRFNVTTNNIPRPELIQRANSLTSPFIIPGTRLTIPYAPLGNFSQIALVVQYGSEFDIALFDTNTARVERLTNGLGDRLSVPYWSHDKSKIAFVGKGGVVFVVNVQTRQIAKIDQVEPTTLLSWAPDNIRLAYSKGNRIVIYNTLTNRSRTLNQPNNHYAQWFPSGTELLFEAADANGVSQLYRISENGSGKQQITSNTEGPLHEVRLSPDGTHAVYTTPGVSISLIRIVEVATGSIFEVPGGPLAKNYNPQWSPNSQTIAYSATAIIANVSFSQIRTAGRDGENDRLLSILSCYATPVSWGPDSRKITYISNCGTEGLGDELWSIDINHPAPRRLLKETIIANLQWMPM